MTNLKQEELAKALIQLFNKTLPDGREGIIMYITGFKGQRAQL